MKYFIITFGCQMNISDSERIASILEEAGHKQADNPESADLIVINSCSVRQSAIDRTFGALNKFKNKKIVLAGCILESDKKKFKDKAQFWNPADYFEKLPRRESQFTAYVPIMTGCNNFCSYCVVPYTRGREKSRPAKEIITEVESLAKRGFKEIFLLGQNVNSYASKFPISNFQFPIKSQISNSKKEKDLNFAGLIKLINQIPGEFWLNFISSHPKDMSDELIETAAKSPKMISYIHLPVQAGDNKILKAMNRRYTVAHYKNLIKKIRKSFQKFKPELPVAISTDIIVGFPGETKKQFQNTLKLAREVKFDMIYLAQYSPREGTAAAKMKDDVPPAEKKRRAVALDKALKKTAFANNKKYIGKEAEVLVDKISNGFAFGKTQTFKNVKFPAGNFKPGDLAKVKIIGAKAFNLRGETIK